MKVYIIVTENCFNGSNQIDTEVFAEYEKAKKAFDFYVKREKREADSLEYETDESENYFSSWEDGYYSMNHVSIELREEEVKNNNE